ncbi:hypothetical protein OEZ86_001942 [Tetradesmus obliquus]|nr:hypothetical protein OEZ86_001942 [Tetradesmus obliquus]
MRQRDNWKKLLIALKDTAAAKLKELQHLQEQRELLKHKEDVLQQIVEGLATSAQLMAASERYAEGADRQVLDQALQSLLRLELEIQFTLQEQPDGPQPAVAAAAAPVSNYIEYLHHVFEPGRAREVLAMSNDEIITKLGSLAGQCALQAVKDKARLGGWDQQQQQQQQQPGTTPQSYSTGTGVPPAGTSSNSNGVQLQGSSSGLACSSSSTPAAPAGLAGTDAFEYICLTGVLFWWDMPRFIKVAFTNFETRQPLTPPPPEFWRLVAYQLQLTPHQIAVFKGLKELLGTAMGGMFAALEASVQEQQAVIQQEIAAQEEQELPQMLQQAQREQQLMMQQMQQQRLETQAFLQQQTPAEQQLVLQQMHSCQQQLLQRHMQQQQHALGEVARRGDALAAHETIVKKQVQVLSTWHIIWMHMGIVTMNTLTPQQHGVLLSCSYPSISRIDPILDFLDELEQQQQQQQQRRQKPESQN